MAIIPALKPPSRNRLTLLLAAVATALFIATAFRGGWVRSTTDFPNYYAAASAVREGKPLADYYDWTWFAEQLNHAGVHDHLGSYMPQTPLTMLPLLPVSSLPPQTAKRIWLIVNLALLALVIRMLQRVSTFRLAEVALIVFCGIGSLYVNFVLGQYYIIVLFLLVAAYYFLRAGYSLSAGALCGLAFGLKLYGGPFLLYFAVRRNWRAFFGMLAVMVCSAGAALAIFGWHDISWYAIQVLPRALDTGAVDPWHPSNATLSTLLRRLFVSEPELNPHPLFNAPWLFFFLRPLALLTIAGFTVACLWRAPASQEPRAFAWFTIAVLLLSTSTSRYTFVILLLPVVLLLEKATRRTAVLLIAAFMLIALPLPLAPFFPRLWLLILLFIYAGLPWVRALRPVPVAVLASIFVLLAALDARVEAASYAREPGRRFQPFAVEKEQIFSSFPVVTTAGVFYQAMSAGRYVLHWRHDGRTEELRFDGNALRPYAAIPDGPVRFQLASHGALTTMEFDPRTRSLAPSRETDPPLAVVPSPDRKWMVRTVASLRATHLLVESTATGQQWLLAGGNCNSTSPAWELNSRALIFATDCGRAFGTPALYRADIDAIPSLRAVDD